MIADISQKREQEFSALWSKGRFESRYCGTIDAYFTLTINLKKSENLDEIKLLEWVLPQMKNAILDMNAFRAAKTAGAAA
jgi:hypothetical protein